MNRRTMAMRMAALGGTLVIVSALGITQQWSATITYAAPPETPEAFLASYVQALRTGDRIFLSSRLDAAVVDLFGLRQCDAALGGLVDKNLSLKLVRTTGPAIRDYDSDGFSIRLPDTYTFTVSGVIGGRQQTRDVNFPLVDGQFRIVMDCGEPAEPS